jgi:hypothetical protein
MAIYELAFHLRIPIYELSEKMTYEELLSWFYYFEKRPVGWREDDRTMKFLQTQGVKEKPWAIFPTLNPIYNEGKEKETNPTSSLEGSSLFQKLMLSKNGDDVDLW